MKSRMCCVFSSTAVHSVYSSSTQQVLFGLINPNLYDESWNDIYFPFEIGCLTQKCVLVRVLVFYQLVRKKNGKVRLRDKKPYIMYE